MIECYCQHIPSKYKAKICRKDSHKNCCYNLCCDESKSTLNWPQKFTNLRNTWSYHCKVANIPLCGYNYWEDQSVKSQESKRICSVHKDKAFPIRKKHLRSVQYNDFINSELKRSNSVKSIHTDSSYTTKSILKRGETSNHSKKVYINKTPNYENTASKKYDEKEISGFNFENNTESWCCNSNSDSLQNNFHQTTSFYDDRLNDYKNKVKFSPSTEISADNIKSQYFDRKMRLYYDLPERDIESFYQNSSSYGDRPEFSSSENVGRYLESQCCNNCNMCEYNLQDYPINHSKENSHPKYEMRTSSGSDSESTESYRESRCCKQRKCPSNLQNDGSNKSTIFDIYNSEYSKHKMKLSSNNKSSINLQNYSSNETIIFDIDNPSSINECCPDKSIISTIDNPKLKSSSNKENIKEVRSYTGKECPYCGQEYKDISRKKYSRSKKNISASTSTASTSSSSISKKYSEKNYSTKSKTGICISSTNSSKKNTKASSSNKRSGRSSKTSLKSKSSSTISRCSTKKTNSSSFLRKTPAKSILPSKSFLKEKKKEKKMCKEKRRANNLAKRNKITFVKNEYLKLADKYKNSNDLYHRNICLKQVIDAVPSNMFPEVPDIKLQFKPPGKKTKYVLKMKNLLGSCHEIRTGNKDKK